MARNRNSIPYRLRRRRRLMQLTQEQVGQRFGHSDATIISRWERGISQPSLENAISLAKLYHTSVEDIFNELSKECDEWINPQEKQKRSKGRDP